MKKVLVVEDDKEIRNLIVELLEDQSYVARPAMNGQVALEILARDPAFDLILLDLMMPVLDGFAFRTEQLSDIRFAKIPVIIMSADGHIAQKLERAQARKFVKKPIDMDHFLATIAAALI